MRYQLAEAVHVLGKFDTGATVTMTLYNIATEAAVSLTAGTCNEIGATGVFKWLSSDIVTQPVVRTAYLWVMSDGTSAQYGKLELGGYPDTIGTPVALDGGTATLAGMLIKIADDNGGLDFNAELDSLHEKQGTSAEEVANAVWDEAISGHTTSTTFGGKNQKAVPSESASDYKATGFSTHSAGDVKTAIEADGGSIAGIKAKTDLLPASPAAVGSEMTLSSGAISSLVTAVWSATARTLTTLGTIVSDIWNATLSSFTTPGTAGKELGDIVDSVDAMTENVELVLGLSHHNFKIINTTYDGSDLVSANVDLFPTNTDCDNDTNRMARYLISVTKSSAGKFTEWKQVLV